MANHTQVLKQQTCFGHKMDPMILLCNWFQCRFDIELGDLDALKRLLAFSAQFIQGLHIEQLPSHLELDILFDGLGKCAHVFAVQGDCLSCILVTKLCLTPSESQNRHCRHQP
jgi:hypothetical protein